MASHPPPALAARSLLVASSSFDDRQAFREHPAHCRDLQLFN